MLEDDQQQTPSSEPSNHEASSGEQTSLLGLADAPRDYSGAALTLHNFYRMSILFSAVHAAALACLSFATARLGSVGAWQSGVLYLAYTASAVFGATYVVKRLGSRNSMLLGMALFNLYVGAFVIVALWPSTLQVAALTGAAFGGVGAGLMWTSQGVYFSQAAEEYSLESGLEWETSTSQLGGIFAFFVLTEETVLEVLATVLIRVFGVPWNIIFAVYTLISIAATIGIATVKQYPKEQVNEATTFISIFYKATAAFQLLIRDSKMKYMIGLNAAFGFAGAFLNSFVSGEVLPVALNDTSSSYVGLFVAIHGGVAAVCSLIFGRVSQYIGKVPVLILGALSFASVAFPFLIQPDLHEWTWTMLVLVYAAEGLGRATFEGTLKAIFADYFPYEKEGAFGNIILQNGLSSAIAYFLSFWLTCPNNDRSKYCIEYRDGSRHDMGSFAGLVVAISLAAILSLFRASYLQSHGETAEAVRQYRSVSIGSYRSSRASYPLDRRTYDALATALQDEVDEDTNAVAVQLPQVT